MTSYVERNLHILETLKNANPELRASIIAHSSPEVIESIAEICHNYVNGNILCDQQHFSDLKKHKTAIRALARGQKSRSKGIDAVKSGSDYTTEIDKKREILLQKGSGFWDAVLLPLMSDLATHFLENIVSGCVNCRCSKKDAKNDKL